MARYHITRVPEGYTIISLNKRFYPAKITQTGNGTPVATGFIQLIDRSPVSYSKRSYAVNFIASFNSGVIEYAQVDSPEGVPA